MRRDPCCVARVQPDPTDTEEARACRAELVRDLELEVADVRVLDAMGRVPRHLFVPHATLSVAYANSPAPIGHGQTISQPTIVALMTEALELTGRERVLEIGTGSGYQAAVLALLATEVHSVENIAPLAEEARARLARLGYANVHVHLGDGYGGLPSEAPFDRIVVTAAPEETPRVLLEQLADGGILVVPVGRSDWPQRLVRYRKQRAMVTAEDLGGVRFVPMVRAD